MSANSFIRLFFTLSVFLLGFTGCKETPEPVPNFREYAYISNGASNNVTVVDLRGLRVQAIVPVGKSPTGLATNPKKNEIYVANTESNNISVIDAESNKVVATIGTSRTLFCGRLPGWKKGLRSQFRVGKPFCNRPGPAEGNQDNRDW